MSEKMPTVTGNNGAGEAEEEDMEHLENEDRKSWGEETASGSGEGEEDHEEDFEDEGGSSEMDEEECDKRKTECMDDLLELNHQFCKLKNQLFNEREAQIEKRMEELQCERDPDYLARIAELEHNRMCRLEVAKIRDKFRRESIQETYQSEELAARQNMENEHRLLYDQLKAELEEKIKRLEEDRHNIDITSDLYRSQNQRKRKRLDSLSHGSEEKAYSSDRCPVIVYSLTDEEIMEDLIAIRRHDARQMAAAQLQSGSINSSDGGDDSNSHNVENNSDGGDDSNSYNVENGGDGDDSNSHNVENNGDGDDSNSYNVENNGDGDDSNSYNVENGGDGDDSNSHNVENNEDGDDSNSHNVENNGDGDDSNSHNVENNGDGDDSNSHNVENNGDGDDSSSHNVENNGDGDDSNSHNVENNSDGGDDSNSYDGDDETHGESDSSDEGNDSDGGSDRGGGGNAVSGGNAIAGSGSSAGIGGSSNSAGSGGSGNSAGIGGSGNSAGSGGSGNCAGSGGSGNCAGNGGSGEIDDSDLQFHYDEDGQLVIDNAESDETDEMDRLSYTTSDFLSSHSSDYEAEVEEEEEEEDAPAPPEEFENNFQIDLYIFLPDFNRR